MRFVYPDAFGSNRVRMLELVFLIRIPEDAVVEQGFWVLNQISCPSWVFVKLQH